MPEIIAEDSTIPTRPESHGACLQADVRLSESMIWSVQRGFYERLGPRAWSDGVVPHYITSNPFIARGYARLVHSFWRDVTRRGVRSTEGAQPRLYLIELGAGHGQLSFLLLNELLARLDAVGVPREAFRYVMTDFSAKNIEAWKAMPQLRSLADAGVLDFARFDLTTDTQLKLECSGETLTPGSLDALVIVANYVFDCIPQDMLAVANGQLHECRVSVFSADEGLKADDPEWFRRISLGFTQVPIPAEHYEDPAKNAVLAGYGASLGDTRFLFPVTAMRSLRTLSRLAHGPTLVVSADKGITEERTMVNLDLTSMALHGNSFSMMVNFHAIGQYVQALGGFTLLPVDRHQSLTVAGFVLGLEAGEAIETRLAFHDDLELFGPDDFLALRSRLDHTEVPPTPVQALAWLRWSGWDPWVLLTVSETFSAPESIDGTTREELRHAARRVWARHLPRNDGPDVAFHLGRMLFSLDYIQDALTFFEHSHVLYGPHRETLHNLALCRYRLGQLAEAEMLAGQVLSLDSGFGPTRALLLSLKAERPQRTERF
jgi:hypothetical protein